MLLDNKAKRRLSLRSKTNPELFALYYDHLKVNLSARTFYETKLLLDKLLTFLGEFPPSVELATKFLAAYSNRSRATLFRYAGMVRGFMDWYGDGLDLKFKRPKHLPQWVNPEDIDKLVESIQKKRSHKGTVERDVLLVRFATTTGLRRSELAALIVADIHLREKMVIVRRGKGDKDRSVPLASFLIDILSEYLKEKKATDSVFDLDERSITDKVSTWSKKAGVKLTPHSFRHFFAEQLLEKEVPLNVVSALLGHEDLQTTAAYLGLRPGSMQEAVDRLDEPQDDWKDKQPEEKNDEIRSSETGESRDEHTDDIRDAYKFKGKGPIWPL